MNTFLILLALWLYVSGYAVTVYALKDNKNWRFENRTAFAATLITICLWPFAATIAVLLDLFESIKDKGE